MNTTNDKVPDVRANQSQQAEMPHQILSEEEIKQYYLIEARMMCPTATDNRSEKARLEILQVRVKRLMRFFSDLRNFQWSDGVRQMQIGYGIYLMDHNIPAKERRKINEAWAQRLAFISGIQGYSDLLSHMLMHYSRQNRDLEKLLATYPADSSANKTSAIDETMC